MGFRHFSQGPMSAEGWGKIYGACCADTRPAVPPPECRGGTGTAPGCSGSFGHPQVLGGAVEGWGSSWRVTWAAQRGLRAFWGETRAPLLFFVLSWDPYLVLGKICTCKLLLRFLRSPQRGKTDIFSNEFPFLLFSTSLSKLRALTSILVLLHPQAFECACVTTAAVSQGWLRSCGLWGTLAREVAVRAGRLTLRIWSSAAVTGVFSSGVPCDYGSWKTVKHNPWLSDAIPSLGLFGGHERLCFLLLRETGPVSTGGHSCSCLIW